MSDSVVTYRAYCLTPGCGWERHRSHGGHAAEQWAEKKAEQSCNAHLLMHEDHNPTTEKVE